ncbi:DUF1593 domain-containing protein [uncultured Draconibacterium sp.]|uniref:DUF1593 domain-containing protein n=1 Tax=uncultured Draconibacterium sp. TaxID=1573823 RepID=UPI0032606B19
MNKIVLSFIGLIFCGVISNGCSQTVPPVKHRIIVSTDIGGTDFDDYQSMAHLLIYADTLDIEGIISSPFGNGRVSHILECVDAYEKDYPNLKAASKDYPSPDAIRAIVKQGATEIVNTRGYDKPTEGSNWIVTCARREDPRPLNVLIWGGIEDLAQALHDAPDILPKLRVHFIGGPNKKWSVNAYHYIACNFPELWIIESNASYRGWFVGGNQSGNWGNESFVEKYIKDVGALGSYFYSKGTHMKMGDTPTLTYWLNGDPEDPTSPSWGGQYVRAWERQHKVFNRLTSVTDSIEEFAVLELLLPAENMPENSFALMHIENQSIKAEIKENQVRFLFSPKRSGNWTYNLESNISGINGLEGELVSYPTPAENGNKPSASYPNWWADNPAPEYKEQGHIGIKTVNRWREEFLGDFARRMKRCVPKNKQ